MNINQKNFWEREILFFAFRALMIRNRTRIFARTFVNSTFFAFERIVFFAKFKKASILYQYRLWITKHWRNVNKATSDDMNTYLFFALEATIASCVLFLNVLHTLICFFFANKSTHRCIDLAIEMSKTSKTQILSRQYRVVDASEKNDVRHDVDKRRREKTRAKETTTSKLLYSLVYIASQRYFAYFNKISFLLIWESQSQM